MKKNELMTVYVSSSDPSKVKPIVQAFSYLGISNYLLEPIDDDLAFENELIEGALERARDCNTRILNQLKVQEQSFDYLVSIEQGYEIQDDNYYLVSYAVCSNKTGKQYVGKSLSIPITKKMYEYFISGKSLNCLIKAITNNKDNKQESSIPNFLSRGLLFKADSDVEAVITSFLPFVNHQEYENLGIQMSKKQD